MPAASSGTEPTMYDVVIVGGGIAGMATAIGLLRRGVTNVLVLEKALTMHPVGASIAIFSNGLKALEYLSPAVASRVRASSIPIQTMVLRDLGGDVIRETAPPGDASVNYLVWYLLQQYLAEELPDGVLRLGCAVESFSVDDNIVTIEASDRGEMTKRTIKTKVLVGADGIHSPIRDRLFGANATAKHDMGKVMYRAVLPARSVANPPPTGTNVSFQGDEPGKIFHYRETAKDILTVTAMARVDDGAQKLQSDGGGVLLTPEEKKEQMLHVFERYPTDVQQVLQHIPPDAIHVNAIQDIDVLDNWSKGPVILIGDAAHAMSPSLGQGANQGLEDACAIVHGVVKEFTSSAAAGSSTPSLAKTLEEICQSRRDRVNMIHAASRARSERNNDSSKSKPIDMTSAELKRVLKEIDAWDAPIDENLK